MPEPDPAAAIAERLRRIAHVALDLDGTIYRGDTLFPWTPGFLAKLERLGIGHTFPTNNPSMLTGILERHALTPERLAMVGDRLYTDVAMAHRAGALGVLVLSGEATREDADRAVPPPDVIVNTLAEFGDLLAAARAGGP